MTTPERFPSIPPRPHRAHAARCRRPLPLPAVHRRRVRRSGGRRVDRHAATRSPARSGRASRAGAPADADRAVQAAHRAFTARRLARAVAVAARRAAAQAGRPHRRERRVARARRDEGQRQAAAPSSPCRCATWRTTTTTTAASPTRWKARSSRPTSRASSTTRSTSRSAWSSCIMPWNSPLPLTSLKLAPALAAGNTVVLKPSEFTSASLLEFVKLVEAAGLPARRGQRRHRLRRGDRRRAGRAIRASTASPSPADPRPGARSTKRRRGT